MFFEKNSKGRATFEKMEGYWDELFDRRHAAIITRGNDNTEIICFYHIRLIAARDFIILRVGELV